MTDKLEGMPSSEVIVDPATGRITPEWRDWFEELVFGSSSRSVGTILSGVNAIKAGEVVLQDVILADRGSLVADQQTQDSNAGSANEFTATVSPSVLSSVGTGTVTTTSATVSVSGGTAPYAITYNSTSGITASGASSLPADGSFAVTWSGNPSGGVIGGVQNIHIEDNAGTPLEANVYVTVTIRDSSFGF